MSQAVTVLIGNSDNELTQHEWSKFVEDVREIVAKCCFEVHFDGGSSFDSRWQNACMVGDVRDELMLDKELSKVRQKWRQFAVAVIYGKTRMI